MKQFLKVRRMFKKSRKNYNYNKLTNKGIESFI